MASCGDPTHIALTDIAGLAEVAERLGVAKQRVSNWAAGRNRSNFPAPLIRLHATPIWSMGEVVDWYQGNVL